MRSSLRLAVLAVTLLIAPAKQCHAFAYIFAGEANGVDLIMHPIGYTGAGGTLNVTVGIDPTSMHAATMMVSVQNVVNTFNNLAVTTNNFSFPLGGTEADFESVLLHEMGHSLGLAHVNAASESGLTGSDQNYTKATDGVNNVLDLDAGVDGVIGSSDDVRGDDVNMNFFKISDNDPFTIAGTVDRTTYSQDLADLPGGHLYSANGDRAVATLLGYTNTEAVMQQGSFFSETQRTLTADDVAGIRYGEAGLDEIAGTADDYSLNLVFNGLDASADIVIDFDNVAPFAFSSSTASFLGGGHGTHAVITSNEIKFNDGFNWFFNQVSNSPVPEPSSLSLLGIFAVGTVCRRRRRKA